MENEIHDCPFCGGSGKIHGITCGICGGKGKFLVVISNLVVISKETYEMYVKEVASRVSVKNETIK